MSRMVNFLTSAASDALRGDSKGALFDSGCILGEGRKHKYATALDPSVKESNEDILVRGVVEFSCVN